MTKYIEENVFITLEITKDTVPLIAAAYCSESFRPVVDTNPVTSIKTRGHFTKQTLEKQQGLRVYMAMSHAIHSATYSEMSW